MADETSRESTQELELYGELGIVPKLGVKIRLARKARVDHMMEAAASRADIDRTELEKRLANSSDLVHDVLLLAGARARDVEDDDYLDVLGRLVAGALDPAALDELSYITSEITRLEPVHLRALFDFFQYGSQDEDDPDPFLSPRKAAWARARSRADRRVAYALEISRETVGHVLLRLDRDGLIELHGGPDVAIDPESAPTEWACRVMALVFPTMKVERDPSAFFGR